MNDKDAEDATLQPPIDAEELILQTRAKVLASPPEAAADTEYIEVVTFVLAYETYAIETAYIDEVHPLKELTPLPCTPAFVAGIINVRGEVLSVIDIKAFFELPAKGLTDLNKVIILSDGVMKFGILADAVLDVKRLPLREMQTSLPTLTGIREDYLRGITADRLIVLDAVGLLSDPKIIVHEEVI